jgi:hypothetical protein
MISQHERRAKALEAIAHGFLELAAIEREPLGRRGTRGSPPAAGPDTAERDAFLALVNNRFLARVGRPMTDDEWEHAEICLLVGLSLRGARGDANPRITETPEAVVAFVLAEVGKEPAYHADWRSLGLDPAALERDGEKLRRKLRRTHPEMGPRERRDAVHRMWNLTTGPLREARTVARAAALAARKAERAKRNPGATTRRPTR